MAGSHQVKRIRSPNGLSAGLADQATHFGGIKTGRDPADVLRACGAGDGVRRQCLRSAAS